MVSGLVRTLEHPGHPVSCIGEDSKEGKEVPQNQISSLCRASSVLGKHATTQLQPQADLDSFAGMCEHDYEEILEHFQKTL